VQLLRASDGVPIWGENFDEKFTDVFALQDRVSQRVASVLSLKLSGDEQRGLSKRYTDSVEAYQLYLKGRHRWMAFHPDSLMTSLNFYNEALKVDPEYALAYAGMANSYVVISLYGPIPAKDAMPKALEAAQKAVSLDDQLSESYVALGSVKIFYQRDWPGAAQALKRAMELDPGNPGPHTLYAYYLQAMGKPVEAVDEYKQAEALAPTWNTVDWDLLEGYCDARQYDEAIKASRDHLRLDPSNSRAHQVLGMALVEKKQFAEAIAELEKAVETGGEFGRPKAQTQLGYAYAVAGRKQDALKVIEDLKSKPNPWLAIHVARIYAGLGDSEQAFVWLKRAEDERFGFLYDIRFASQFDSLRSDPRFGEILRRMNLSL
jgi:tetratricopeptide (TPR) repeat protein